MTDKSDPSKFDKDRVFLIVVDDTEEWHSAMHFVCRRALHTGGRVALLHVIEPAEFQHWMSVEEVMREERRQDAERLLQKVAKQVNEETGSMPELHLREGARHEQLVELIEEQPSISVLVLGASTSSEGPGPLIQYLTTKAIGRLRIPVTILPGGLSDDEIDRIA